MSPWVLPTVSLVSYWWSLSLTTIWNHHPCLMGKLPQYLWTWFRCSDSQRHPYLMSPCHSWRYAHVSRWSDPQRHLGLCYCWRYVPVAAPRQTKSVRPAFSVGLTHNISFTQPQNVAYDRVFLDSTSSYNPVTGTFLGAKDFTCNTQSTISRGRRNEGPVCCSEPRAIKCALF